MGASSREFELALYKRDRVVYDRTSGKEPQGTKEQTMVTVTREQLEKIAEALNVEDDDVRTNYSGRGMFGRTCVGFDLDYTGQLFELGRVIGQVLGDEAEDWGNPSTDGMGRGIIAYFTNVQLEGTVDSSFI